MWRDAGGVAAGVVTWWVAAAAGYWLLRISSPEYALAEPTADFTAVMLLARLLVGIVCSILAGGACGAVAGPESLAPAIVSAVMLVLLVPIQYSVWNDYPNWYHIVFVGSVGPVVMRSARIASRHTSGR
jgi:hypothetical protein